MVITTNAYLIPGIWSLAPASSIVRIGLQTAATESSCNLGAAEDNTGTARDTRDSQGDSSDRQ